MNLPTTRSASKAQSCRYSAREWEAQKNKIDRLYVTEERPLKDVRRILSEEFGFIVSEKQLKTRLAKWRFDTKNVKGDMMLEIARKQAKRKRVDGKDSAFCVNEKPVEQQKIRRYLRRNNISEGELLSMASPCNGVSTEFSVFTPAPVSPDPFPESLSLSSTASLHGQEHDSIKLMPIAEDLVRLVNSLASDIVEEAPDLFDALLSLTAIEIPDLIQPLSPSPRTGIELPENEDSLPKISARNMAKAMRCLNSQLGSISPGPKQEVRMEICIASALILALSSSWHNRRQTEFREHLAGARALLHLALKKQRDSDGVCNPARLEFLCNAWLYLDTMSCLTCFKDSPLDRNAPLLMKMTFGPEHDKFDSLMGCATTLFLLIRRAIVIYREVRNSESTISNGGDIFIWAAELQREIEQWKPPTALESSRYPSAQISDALATAEALRLATLLCLHQCVRQLPSESSYDLAQQVILHLTKTSTRSTSVFVHTFPLLVAGCEAYQTEEREWIRRRWEGMSKRVRFKKLGDFWTVTQEVWRRRDAFLLASQNGYSTEIILREDLGFVGGFHWAGVMRDWGWELLF